MASAKAPATPLVVIMGSTGTGKSDLAVELASQFNGEIINADAMQMYKGLPIITNKITLEEQKSVPHHLLGTIGLDQDPWDAYVYKQEASKVIKEIRSRGKLPIVVGGSHHYIDGLLFRDRFVEEDKHGDGRLEMAEKGEKGEKGEKDEEKEEHFPVLDEPTSVLWEKLNEVDPVMAEKWHPNDRRKIRRSLEIYLQTGRPASEIYAEQRKARHITTPDPTSASEEEAINCSLLFWLHTSRETLLQRLSTRVDKMLERGLLHELHELRDYLGVLQQQNGGNKLWPRHTPASTTTVDQTKGIWQSIGVKELAPYLDMRVETMDRMNEIKGACLDAMKFATHRYAKNQLRWITKKTLPLILASSPNASSTAPQDDAVLAVDGNNTRRLYLLDTTTPSSWQSSVSTPASMLTALFLAGTSPSLMPDPTCLSTAAASVLESSFAIAQNQLSSISNTHQNGTNSDGAEKKSERHLCEICGTTHLTNSDWAVHLKGKKHRRQLREKHHDPDTLVPSEAERAERRVERERKKQAKQQRRNDDDDELGRNTAMAAGMIQ